MMPSPTSAVAPASSSNGAPTTTTTTTTATHVTIASILSHSLLDDKKAEATTTTASPRDQEEGGGGDIPAPELSSFGTEAMAAAVATKSTTATDGVGVDAATSMKDDPANQSHLLQVLWSDGSTSWVPMSRLLAERKDADTLLQVVRYLHTHDLLISTPSEGGGGEDATTTTTTTTSWSRRLPDHVQKQLPIVLVPDTKHKTYLNDIQHLHVIDTAIQRGFNQMVARKRPANDNSYRTLREGVYEIFVDGATTRKPAGSTGGEEAYDVPGSNGNDAVAGPNALVDVQKGSKMYTSMVLRLKKQLEACLPHGEGKVEERSIQALTSFAERTASQDPSLSELRKLAKAESAHAQDQPSNSDTPPAEPSDPPDTVTPSSTSSEDDTDAVIAAPEAENATDVIKASANDVVFGSYSCLVSAKGKDAQFRHVDAHSYERQYCMAITGGTSLPTVTHIVVDQLDTPNQVVNLWNELVRDYAKVHPSFDHESDVLADDAALHRVADSIQTVMEATPWMVEWIEEYGKVLSRPGRTVEVCGKWSPGTVLSVPGGNVHHAPPNEEFRSILFFTSSPAGMKTYDVDMQYSGPTLTASLLIGLREAADDDQGMTTSATTLTSDLLHEYMHRVQYMSVREDPSVVDFTSYLHDAIPMNDPIRLAMLEAHQHKLTQLERDAEKATEEAVAAAALTKGGRRLRLSPEMKKPRRS